MIVVLIIISLIAVPIVLNIIERARRGAAVSSARSYIRASETYVLTGQLNKSDNIFEKNNKYNVTKETTIGEKTYQKVNDLVEIKGSKPNGIEDYVTLGDTYNIVEAKFTINGYEILIQNDEVISITKKGKLENMEDDDNGYASLLSEKVEIGDYVAYDADEWTSSAEKPTGQGQFGGYTNGQNKANTVDWCNSSESQYTTTLKGWRVLKIENNKVYLVHAGQPECYYHSDGGYSAISVANLNNRALSEYLNSKYAESAHNMTKDEVDIVDISSTLRTINSPYWLATSYDASNCWIGGRLGGTGNYSNKSFGIRPVIVLKSNIKTSGKGTDIVGNNAWKLIAS